MLFDSSGKFTINSLIDYPDDSYESLRDEAVNCERCQLRERCNQVVMGEGNLDNKIMLIGEGPGADEDRLGRPFVGRAGKLLNKIMKQVGIEREEVYITNIVKCRPPGNRQPTLSEAQACFPILKSEIIIIDPKVIVPLGSTALKYLLDKEASITKMRGEWVKRGELYFLPTFHPAYLLRNSRMKKYVVRDFKLIKKSLERIAQIINKEKSGSQTAE